MREKDHAEWNGDILTVTSEYDDGLIDVIRLQKEGLESEKSTYFVCADGDSYALRSLDGQSCIRSVEKGLELVGETKRVYISFALKSKTPSALKSWRTKWAKRTAPVSKAEAFWDASVRTIA